MAKRCDCYSRFNLLEPGEYERVWIEATRPSVSLTDEDQQELLYLAELADRTGDLCSTFFPLFLKGLRQEVGHEPCRAVRVIAKRIEEFGNRGAHFSSSVTATLLREVAR